MQLDNGQMLQDRIDLRLKANGGWMLVDHKSNSGSMEIPKFRNTNIDLSMSKVHSGMPEWLMHL